MKTEQQIVRWENIEIGLGSVGRLRILRKLLQKPSEAFTKYSLEKATGLKPVDVRSDLKILLDLGWVKECGYDPISYKGNLENKDVKLITEFFRNIR